MAKRDDLSTDKIKVHEFKDQEDFNKVLEEAKKNNAVCMAVRKEMLGAYKDASTYLSSEEFTDMYVPHEKGRDVYSAMIDELAKSEAYLLVKATVEELVNETFTVDEFNKFMDDNMSSDKYKKMIATYTILHTAIKDN